MRDQRILHVEIIMNISESCAKCLYDKQKNITDDPVYLAEVLHVIRTRKESDTAPLLVYRFNQIYHSMFGETKRYAEIKKRYNDLALSMEAAARKKIEAAEDPVGEALGFSRIGNYIDFGAMNEVSEEQFFSLFSSHQIREQEQAVYQSFLSACEKARTFLLLADNCGEIVFDKLLLEQLAIRFPKLSFSVMVRGGEVLNDATVEDAEYVGIDHIARILSNGAAIAGTVYEMLPQDAKEALDHADVVLSKGQGNYESLATSGHHIFCSFLCKCDLFTERFQVPKLTGMFTEMNRV